MTEVLLNLKRPNTQKLLSFGFEKRDGRYIYLRDIVKGQMSLTVTVSLDGAVYTELIDKSSEEEYVLHRVTNAQGSFVGQVKAEYEAIPDEVSSKCFDPEVFIKRNV